MIGFGATGAADGATLGPDDGAALPAGADAAGADAAGAGTRACPLEPDDQARGSARPT